MDKRLLSKPKYKIGDLIVYQDRYREDEDDLNKVMQGVIVEAYSLIDLLEKKDKLTWYYYTKELINNCLDPLEEEDIFYKL